jgi:hypothetical protein
MRRPNAIPFISPFGLKVLGGAPSQTRPLKSVGQDVRNNQGGRYCSLRQPRFGFVPPSILTRRRGDRMMLRCISPDGPKTEVQRCRLLRRCRGNMLKRHTRARSSSRRSVVYSPDADRKSEQFLRTPPSSQARSRHRHVAHAIGLRRPAASLGITCPDTMARADKVIE